MDTAHLRDDDPDARRRLFEHCQGRLRPFFLHRLPNPDDVEDCVSEVVTRALEGIRRGHEPDVPEAWLFGIANNVLKERYRAARRDGGGLPDDVVAEPGEVQVTADRRDRPGLPAELEYLLGKEELLDVLGTAVKGIGAVHQAIMRAHIEQTLRRGRLVVGAELAKAVGMPVDRVTRELDRARKATRRAIVSLTVARRAGAGCPELAGLVGVGRSVELDQAGSAAVLKHARECAVCGPRAEEARPYSRWALGPGLLGLADDDEERRRLLLALFSRSGEASARSSATAAVGGTSAVGDTAVVSGTAAVGGTSGGVVERVRDFVAGRVATPRIQAAVQFAQQNPELVRRTVSSVVGSGAVVALLVGLILANPDEPGIAQPGPTTTTRPADAAVPASNEATTTTTPGVPSRRVDRIMLPDGGEDLGSDEGTRTGTPAATPAGTPAGSTTGETAEPPARSTGGPTAPRPGSVAFDVTDTDYPRFAVSGVAGWHDTRQRLDLDLVPGPYTLRTEPGTPLDFRVTEAKRFQYAPSLEGVLTGAGTSTLTVHGRRVAVDASDVDHGVVGVGGVGVTTERNHTYRLLPGPHHLVLNGGRSSFFTVTADGRTGYDPALEGLLTGSGTSTLALHGHRVVLDITDVDYSSVGVNGTFVAPTRRHTYRLFPGAYYLVVSNARSLFFSVTTGGRVGYDPVLHGMLTGADTTTLAVHGFPITFDARGSGFADFGVGGVGPWRDASRTHTLRLLPGLHHVLVPGGGRRLFEVTDGGRVGYDPGMEGSLSGAGGTVLVIRP